ncbi:HEAT repeat domain-containing protein [bacterium]|nr:HEAT repeat domain-containing protein [bacterium]
MTLSTIPSSLSSAFDALDDDLKLPVEMLMSDSRDDRLVAVVNLQHLCDEESVPFLIHALSDDSDDVVFTAVTSLWEIANQTAVLPLIDCLSSTFAERIRLEALNALKELVNQDHLLALLDQLVKSDVALQASILILLRKIHDIQALPSVAPFLSSEHELLRKEAVTTLRYLNQLTHFPPAILLASDSSIEVRKEAMLTFAHLDEPDVIPALITSLLEDTSWEVRRNAAQALDRKSNPSSADALALSISDDHWQVRKFSLRALNAHVSENHISNILPLLCDDYSDVRKEAALALGGISTDQSRAALKRSINDSDIEVRIASEKSLALIGN